MSLFWFNKEPFEDSQFTKRHHCASAPWHGGPKPSAIPSAPTTWRDRIVRENNEMQ